MTLSGKSFYKCILYIFPILFVIVSCFMFFQPQKVQPSFRSSQLIKKVTEEDGLQRTVFVNQEGALTFASDVGYAIMTLTDTKDGTIEKHFNTAGDTVRFKSQDYYAIYRKYDERGNNTETIYLDDDGKPIANTYGYAKILRTFSVNGHILTERYFDAKGENVCSTVFGYQKTNEYDDDLLIKQTYLDDENKPMVTDLGYASIIYKYYSPDSVQAGMVESEYYYDEAGEPKSLSLGQYGIHKEYDDNGLISVITYLDINGNPIITTKGYTTVIRKYQANNSIASERYYDAEGNPIKMTEGQYGKEIDNGIVYYLNSEGEKTISIKNVVYKYSGSVVFIGMIMIAVSAVINKKANWVLLFLYLGVIGYFTLLGREKGNSFTRFEILWSYKQFFSDEEIRNYIMRNIWLFIPLGAVLFNICPKKAVLLVSVIISVIIEIVQLITGTGLCEIDDVISNSTGGWFGFCAAKLTTELKLRINKRK